MTDQAFSFLVTTDNHMGYKEDDHVRRKDSYRAFKEALSIARNKDADFILLGGDLFHVNRPSDSVEHKCIKIIRQHMNAPASRGTSFKRIQGNFSHFHKLNHANFEDQNFTVPYPIMTIHGNHDDPTGPNAKSVCEKLATCGLLNYFGAITSTKDICVEPIVFQKGLVKIAMYGLGFIPDYKLKIAFDKGEVKFVEPPKDSFNVLVVHQNRVPYQKCKVIPDDLFPTFFHLIVRGHEHNTMSPEKLPESAVNGMVYQPGSTVATSISIMEAAPKKVGFFKVSLANPRGDSASMYKMDYELIELKCCRPMIFKDITQKEILKHVKKVTGCSKITSAEFQNHSKEFIASCIRNLLEDCNSQQSSLSSNLSSEGDTQKLSSFRLPIVRVRIEYCAKNERFDEFDVSLQFFPSRVANKDIVMFKKQVLQQTNDGAAENVTFAIDDEDEDQDESEFVNLGEEKRDTIDVMIEGYFRNKPEHERLQALSLREYTNAVRGASEDGNVISKVMNKKKQLILNQYKTAIANEEKAGLNFHDEHLVHNWFISAFKKDITDFADDNIEDMDVVLI